ncbi:MAG: hypothetical protein DRN08_05200 [Thermoplasmata archaeon]|nr:MAG: hypothetical protein DRN08_05200 [Thermoplasmata archaeon]
MNAEHGIFTPSSGIINVHQLMDFLVEDFKEKGGLIGFGEKVIGIERINDGYKVFVENGNFYKTRILINSAGLFSDEISRLVGIEYHLFWAKGDYFSLNKSLKINRLIYPVPGATSLGIHLTPKMNGGFRVGPDIEYVKRKKNPYPSENGKCDFYIKENKREKFLYSLKKFLPGIRIENLSPEMYGIRPKLQGPEDNFRDFIIQEEKKYGLSGFINLLGIVSPGLTCCLSIGGYVKNLIRKI